MLTLAAFTILYPLAWMLYSSFKSNTDILANIFALPSRPTLENFVEVFGEGDLAIWLMNSAIITVGSVLALIVLASLAAYAFASFDFRGKEALFLFMLVGLMIPPQALVIAGFKWVSILQLLNTYWALIFTYCG